MDNTAKAIPEPAAPNRRSWLPARSGDYSGGIAGPRMRGAGLSIALVDIAVMLLALGSAAALRLNSYMLIQEKFFTHFTGGTTAQVALTLVSGYVIGLYDLEPRMRRLNTSLRVIAAVAISVALASVIYFWAPWWQLWRSILVYYFIYASIWMIGWRLLVWRWISKAVPLIRCVLVGDEDDEHYAKELESHPWIRFEVAKKVSEPELTAQAGALFEICQGSQANSVITGPAISPRLVPQLLYCKGRGIDVQRLISIFMATTGRIPVAYIRPDDIAFGPSFSLRTSRLHRTVHRILDLTVSSLLLVATSPLQLLAIIAVAIESGRPVFYKQDRVGQDETEFEILKIRTMVQDAEQETPQWSTQRDPRVTRVGRLLRRTRVDELPQLLSVLKGDMSFIGPRPERRFFVDQLEQSVPYYSLRHSVRPGLTGWAQVNHGYGSSTDDARRKLEFDLFYIQESSFLLDCIILLRTIRTVISRPGS